MLHAAAEKPLLAPAKDFLADFVLYWYQSWVKDEKPDAKAGDGQPPAELSARADYLADEDFLADFVLYWYQSWVKDEKPDAKAGDGHTAFSGC
ncbi:hypothetical protein AK812_SmicGene45656 [Symbiodinium microadriaticum]|uniref:Uncharacterized protein n=1 Tax=Symbiodinium microadriaticum TaxID=2951 RepID=A0A1Q9BVN5_SYMMI|nr:hypothetical protein AK812_SmicGene45656 [Symbiodinium microadriaticum]